MQISIQTRPGGPENNREHLPEVLAETPERR